MRVRESGDAALQLLEVGCEMGIELVVVLLPARRDPALEIDRGSSGGELGKQVGLLFLGLDLPTMI